jgi:hypothetical protein
MEYLELWDIIFDVVLHEGVPDRHIWRISNTSPYNTKSAYDALFHGAIHFEPSE